MARFRTCWRAEGEWTVVIPTSPEELGPAWLTEALRSSGVLRTASVVSSRAKPIDDEASFNAQLVRLNVSFDRDEDCAPRSMIVKLPTADAAVREVGEHFRPNETEIRFYRDLAPSSGIRTPRHYHSAMDPGTRRFVLILEDLAPARVLDQAAGCSVARAELALRNLALLHAGWWESPRRASLGWLSSPAEDEGELLNLIGDNYARAWPSFVELAGGVSGPVATFGEALEGEMGRISLALQGPPRTLTHGDFRLANVMFGTQKGGPPFAAIDWEDVSVGPGAVDVAWFVVGGLSMADRRERERELLEGYHRTLVGHGVPEYPFERLWEDYRTALLDRFVQAVLLAASPSVFTRRRRFGRALAERFIAASEDHRLIEGLRS